MYRPINKYTYDQKIIALDYDETYTLNPELWNMFIDLASERGFKVICVTMRYIEEGKEVDESIGRKCQIIYTGRIAKRTFLDKIGIRVDVWIDDNPYWIFNNG